MNDKTSPLLQLYQLGQLQRIEQETEADREEEARQRAIAESANEAHIRRRFHRVRRWALKMDRTELLDQLSWAVVLMIEMRGTARALKGLESALKQANGSQAVALRVEQLARIHAEITLGRKLAELERKKALDRKGIEAKLAKDPKQAAKLGAFELWKERHAGMHPKLGTVEQFATEVMRRWPILKSAKVICRWSAEWGKAARERVNPSS